MDTTNLFRLDGRIALVTGGSRGIGKMIAAGFIAQGAKVYISSRKAPACEDNPRFSTPNPHWALRGAAHALQNSARSTAKANAGRLSKSSSMRTVSTAMRTRRKGKAR